MGLIGLMLGITGDANWTRWATDSPSGIILQSRLAPT